jgi:SEC-C motif
VDPSPSSPAIHPDRASGDDDRVDTVREETPMAKVRRNEPCPCGSAKKAKRCCLSPQRRAAATEARRAFRDLCHDVAPDLDGVDRPEFDELFHEAIHLPELDLSLQIRLPALSSPAIERARAALHDDNTDTFDDALWDVAEQLDTPQRRLDLARAIIDYRNAGNIDPKVAAVAVFDLSDGTDSAVLISSIAESIGVSTGDTRTPAGLLVVTT